jgi:hypothetical protein
MPRWKTPGPKSRERKPTDIVQVGLRLREGFRQRVVAEARKNQVSISAEIERRIKQTFEAGALRDLEAVATELAGTWANWKARESEIRKMCDAWTEKGRREKAGA